MNHADFEGIPGCCQAANGALAANECGLTEGEFVVNALPNDPEAGRIDREAGRIERFL